MKQKIIFTLKIIGAILAEMFVVAFVKDETNPSNWFWMDRVIALLICAIFVFVVSMVELEL